MVHKSSVVSVQGNCVCKGNTSMGGNFYSSKVNRKDEILLRMKDMKRYFD